MSSNDRDYDRSFWQSLPGILTGIAAILASIAAIITASQYIEKPQKPDGIAIKVVSEATKDKTTLCPTAFSPQVYQGHTGRVALYNEWKESVNVVLYHPNTRSIYDRYSVPEGTNLFLGKDIIVGDDWGVCLENKPGTTTGRVHNLGTIVDYNPDFQGKPLFMVQNGRI